MIALYINVAYANCVISKRLLPKGARSGVQHIKVAI